jgi:hypothetical protein
MAAAELRVAYASAAEYLAAHDAEISKCGLLVRGATLDRAAALEPCTLVVEISGEAVARVPGRIAAAVPGVGVAVVFEGMPPDLASLAARLRSPAAEAAGEEGVEGGAEEAHGGPRGTVADRLDELTVAQKIAQAMSGDREVRMALLRDVNKSLHGCVLRNPRIGLDEVQWAAKLTTLSPDALKLIAENKEWGANATVCTALVRNPKTPLPLALRLLDRVPIAEVRAIAKGGARDALVHAARKRVNG